ncbi:hypothetical protein [Bradyrhizobium sp. ORS 375]|uniref:hypothetical protein n=1 Tax=Bradyrhizobium sp. (strain ORS 375) TaxID=566679 RepID=UPI0011121FC2|nr:hypothetical protein [Bradyrhizobium sp. ORS 375]
MQELHLEIAHLPQLSGATTAVPGASGESGACVMQNRQSREDTDWVSVVAIVSVFLIASLALHFGWQLR